MTYFIICKDEGPPHMETFKTLEDSKDFIEKRISQAPSRTLDMYVLIEGKRLFLKKVEARTRVEIIDEELKPTLRLHQ